MKNILQIVGFLLFDFLISSSCKDSKSIQYQQYLVQGEVLYQTHCSNCHQKSGSGLGRLYPPLNQSDYMDAKFEKVICLMKYGGGGPIEVNGVNFNMTMKGIPSLTELELSEIATYIYNNWSHHRGQVRIEEVSGALKKCEH